MSGQSTPSRILRSLLAGDELIVAPGVYDGFSVKLVERAGFSAAYMTGGGLAAVHGAPDVNLLSLSEIVDAARLIAHSTTLPIIADADSGYGGPLNIRRCVRDLEDAGVAAIHLEDQPFPKRCASHDGVTLVSIDEMCQRIHIALEERRDPDFVIIARTDATIDDGEASRRLNAYRDAGADVLFNCSITTVEQAKRNIADVPGVHLYNYRGGDKGPMMTHAEIAALGYRILTYSIHGLRLMAKAYQDMLASLRAQGDIRPWIPQMIGWDAFQDITGVVESVQFEQRNSLAHAK